MQEIIKWLIDGITSSEFLSAMTGAIVGGFIAFRIQIVALKAAKTQREEDSAERKKALAHSLLFKSVKIYSNLGILREHLEEAFAKLDKPEIKMNPWQVVQPILNSPTFIHFTSDEMALVLSLKGETFNAIVSFDDVHNSTIEIHNSYRQMRMGFLPQLQAEIKGGMKFEVLLTPEQYRKIAPQIAEMDDLLVGLRERCRKDVDEAWDVLSNVHGLFVEKLGFTYKIEKKH